MYAIQVRTPTSRPVRALVILAECSNCRGHGCSTCRQVGTRAAYYQPSGQPFRVVADDSDEWPL